MYLIGSQYNIRIFRIMNSLFYNALRVKYLKFFSKLKSLIIKRKNIINARYIKNLENLETINLSRSTIDDISFIKSLKNLKKSKTLFNLEKYIYLTRSAL